ncbi:MAG TPA: flagellar basal body-associated FliL family protein [Caulobacterales bacterium]|nr:flagellar basal body-associated FliL family protein [Caulobacterales bacterium]
MAKKEKPPKPPKPPKPVKPKKGKKGQDGAEAIAADAEEAKIAKAPGEEGAEGEEGAPAKKKLAGKTLVLFIVLPALLLLGGGGAAGYFLFMAKPQAHAEAGQDGHGKPKKKKEGGHGEGGAANAAIKEGEDGVYYYAMPEMLVNITSGDGRPVYLKLKLTIEAPDEDVAEAIEPQLPRVTDQFQAFLRELRVDDLAGSAGAQRLRMELLRRVNLALAPAQVNAVLIEEMLVQ